MELRFACRKCFALFPVGVHEAGSEIPCPSCNAQVVLPAHLLSDGYVLGDFEVAGTLGVDGDGSVYIVYDLNSEKACALRVPSDEQIGGAERTEAFLGQVAKLQEFDHSHLIRIISTGQIGEVCFYVTEYCEGGSLTDRLKDDALQEAEALQILDQLACALGYLHERNFFPRDLNPSKIKFDNDDKAKLGDYALAQPLFSRTESFETKTVCGTPAYLSPEQAGGAVDADARANLYMLGAIAFEMFTGRPPFVKGTDMETIAAHLAEPPPDPRKFAPVSAWASSIVLRLLSKKPEERFQTTGELIEALRATRPSTPRVVARPRVVAKPLPRPRVAGTSRIAGKPRVVARSVIGTNPRISSAHLPAIASNPTGVYRPKVSAPVTSTEIDLPDTVKAPIWGPVLFIIITLVVLGGSAAIIWKLNRQSSLGVSTATESFRPSSSTASSSDEAEEIVGKIKFRRRSGEYQITAPKYTALIGADGNLHRLAVGVADMLDDNISYSRGAYIFLQPLIIEMKSITRQGAVITATNGPYTAIYNFNPDGLDITLRHVTTKSPVYFITTGLRCTSLLNLDTNENAVPPKSLNWSNARFTTALGPWLEVRGVSRLSGPWEGKHQVLETNLPSNTDVRINLRLGKG